MKLYTKLLSFIICVGFLGFSSCSGDDAGTEDEISGQCADFLAEWENVTVALQAYSENPTVQKCEDYKDAMIDFYEEFEDCQYWGAQYQEAIDEVQAMDCSETEAD